MLAQIDRLGMSVAPSEEEKGAFLAAQRRQRQLMRRLMKNVRTKSRFLAQCGGHPLSIEARAILVNLAKKIKRDERAFNTRVEATMRVVTTIGMFSKANVTLAQSDQAIRRAKAALSGGCVRYSSRRHRLARSACYLNTNALHATPCS